jgi:hypothetical protein
MKQLNEYIMTQREVEEWRKTWDGKWESIPDTVHEAMIKLMKDQLLDMVRYNTVTTLGE